MSKMRRPIAMAGAYIAASIVAGAIIAAGIALSPGGPIGPIDFDFLQIAIMFLGLVSCFVAVLALPPAALVSWYAERHGKRSALFYGGAGALISLLALGIYVAVLIWNDTSADRFSSMGGATAVAAAIAIITGVFVLAGIAAGLTYWAIAGRNAGARTIAPIAT